MKIIVASLDTVNYVMSMRVASNYCYQKSAIIQLLQRKIAKIIVAVASLVACNYVMSMRVASNRIIMVSELPAISVPNISDYSVVTKEDCEDNSRKFSSMFAAN